MDLVKKNIRPVLKKDGAPAIRPRLAATAPPTAAPSQEKDKGRYVYWAFLVFFLLLAGLLAENYLYMSGKRKRHEERGAVGGPSQARALPEDQRRMNESAAEERYALRLVARAKGARGLERIQLLELARQRYSVSLNYLNDRKHSGRCQGIKRNMARLAGIIDSERKELEDEAARAAKDAAAPSGDDQGAKGAGGEAAGEGAPGARPEAPGPARAPEGGAEEAR